MKQITLTLSLSILFTLGSLLFVSSTTNSQRGCCTPPQFPPLAPKWPRSAAVHVIVSSAFTAIEKQAIVDGFNEWNSVSSLNCSGVTFTGFESSDTPLGHLPFTHWVQYQDVSGSTAAVTTINGLPYAETTFSNAIRNGYPPALPAYIRGLARHEIGHTFPRQLYYLSARHYGNVLRSRRLFSNYRM